VLLASTALLHAQADLQSLDAALARNPRDPKLLTERGILRARAGDPARARADLEAAVHIDPSIALAWQNLGRLCPSQPDATSCAVTAWQGLLKLNQQDPEARFSLAAAYERQKKYRESLRQLELLPSDERARPGALVLRAANLVALGNEKEAVAAAQGAVESQEFVPGDATWLFRRLDPTKQAAMVVALTRSAVTLDDRRRVVQAYESLKRWKDARALLETIYAEEPRNPEHLFELARVAYSEHDLEGSLGYLAHARDLLPSDPRVHFLFGLVVLEMNLPPEARKSLQKAVELAPDNVDYRYALGLVILRDRDPSPAIDCFQRYVKARPDDPNGVFALGVAYFLTGDYEESAAQMSRLKDKPAVRPGALLFLGRIARIDGRLEDAAELLEQAIYAHPFAQAYGELARVRMDQGRDDDARKAITKSLEMDSDNFQANTTLLALYQRAHDPRAAEQRERLRGLDEQRSKAQDLMLRGIEVRPY
jgi:tetratricopeptide (TPR) repeat protein